MRILEYLRKSRVDLDAELRGEGETLARHERILSEYAKKQGFEIGAVYKEVVSGDTIASRPMMQRLLSEVEQGMWDGVLVIEVERLARGDTIDQGIVAQTFKYSNTKIITPTKTYDPNNEFDEEYFEFGLFMSRREYKTIRRRLEQGRLASVKEGRYIGSVAPYGYDRARTDKGEPTLVPNKTEAEAVRHIYSMYTNETNRIGVSKIVRWLNSSDYKPRHGSDWSPATLRTILTNPVYIGKIRWDNRKTVKTVENGIVKESRMRSNINAIIVDGIHEPLIDEKTFKLAQYYLSQNPARPISDKNKMTNVLSGLVVCDMCGHMMIRRPYPNREPSLMCANSNCKNVSTDLSSVEKKIINSLRQWLSQYKIDWNTKSQKQSVPKIDTDKILNNLSAEHKKLKKQLDNAYDLVEQGIYSAEVFIERSNALKNKIAQNEAEQKRIKDEAEAEQKRTEQKRQIVPKVEHLLDVYEQMNDVRMKNEMLHEVIEKVVYRKEKSGRWGDPEDYEIKVYPKLPENDL